MGGATALHCAQAAFPCLRAHSAQHFGPAFTPVQSSTHGYPSWHAASMAPGTTTENSHVNSDEIRYLMQYIYINQCETIYKPLGICNCFFFLYYHFAIKNSEKKSNEHQWVKYKCEFGSLLDLEFTSIAF